MTIYTSCSPLIALQGLPDVARLTADVDKPESRHD